MTRDYDTGNCLSRSTRESVCDSSGAGDGKSLKPMNVAAACENVRSAAGLMASPKINFDNNVIRITYFCGRITPTD